MPDPAGPQESTATTTPGIGRRAFLLNALSSYGQRALVAISALLLTPYLFRSLGTDGFGTLSVMLTLTTVFTMIELGFSLGTTKFIAELQAGGRREEMEATLGATLVLMALLGLIAFATSVLVALFASGLAADGEREEFRVGMLILGAGYMVRLPLVAYGSVLAGYQRYDLYYGVGHSIVIVGTALGAVVAVEAGGGVLGVAIAYTVAFVAGGVAYAALLRRIDPSLRLHPRRSDRRAGRKVLGFSTFTLLADSMNYIAVGLDNVVIAAIRNAAAAAPFAAASKLQSGLHALTLPVLNLMLPMISDLEARGMREAVVWRLLLATRVTLQVTLPVALAVALFSSDIVDVWLGPSAPAVTASILTVLAIYTVMLCQVPSQKVLLGVGHARAVAILNTAWGISNLAISIVLVIAYGAIGAALGTLISTTLIGPANFPLACRATGCPLPRLLRVGLWPAIASSLPSIAVMLPVWLLMSPGGGRLALGVALGVGVAALVGILQLGPRRSLAELRSALRRSEPELDSSPSQLAVEGPT
jgi:O-antigen/teichoic acid export membrane protein